MIGRPPTAYTNLLDKALRETQNRSLNALSVYDQLTDTSVAQAHKDIINNAFSGIPTSNVLAPQLKTVAFDDGWSIGCQRASPSFFVGFGGWDQHDNLLTFMLIIWKWWIKPLGRS